MTKTTEQKRLVAVHFTAPPRIGGLELASAELTAAAERMTGWHGVLVSGTPSVDSATDSVERVCLESLSTELPLNREIFAEFRQGREHKSLMQQVNEIASNLDEILKPNDLLVSFNCFSIPFNIALTAALTKVVSQRADLVHVTWSWDLAHTDPEYDWTRKNEWPWSLLWNRCERTNYFACSEVVAALQADFLRVERETIDVVPGGIDPIRALKLTDRIASVCHNANLFGAYPLLFMPAKFSKRKNIPRALLVLREIRNHFNGVHLILAGSRSPHDSKGSELLHMIADMVERLDLTSSFTILSATKEFSGDVQYDDTMSMAAIVDGMLFTSVNEGFLFPILESGLFNVPIFAPACPAVTSWANELAYLYPESSTPGVIARLITEFFTNRQNARKYRVRSGFTWDKIFSEHFSPLTL